MRVHEIMSKPAVSCRTIDMINRAAQLMWDHDCGMVPVLDEAGKVAGVLTDRDVCMAAYTEGKRLQDIPVSHAMASNIYCCRADDPLENAERLMSEGQFRRLPVVDAEGRPVGVISLADIARYAANHSTEDDGALEIIKSIAFISQPRRPKLEVAPKAPLVAPRLETRPEPHPAPRTRRSA